MQDLETYSPANHSVPSLMKGLLSRRGMTLVEVVYSMALVTLFTSGILASMLYSRRVSELAVRQNVAIELAQGYSEQIKNMGYEELVESAPTQATIDANPTLYVIKTMKDETTADYMALSPGTPFSLAGFNAATATCPNLRSVVVNPANDRLLTMNMKFWVWVNDPTTEKQLQLKTVTIHYAYEVKVTGGSKWYTGTVKSMRSRVPTF